MSERVDDDAETATASILLVDDHPANLLALEAILEPLGQRLERATSGPAALARLRDEEFTLVLLDVQMPGMDGFEVASIIRTQPATAHLPIIFLTAVSRDPGHIFEGYELGAVDYLLKPLDANVLRAKVSVFVDLDRKNKLIVRQRELLRQREIEALERENERRFRVLTDSMAGCIWAADLDGRFYYANRLARDYGPSGAEPGFVLAVSEEDRARADNEWRAAIGSETAFELECRLACPGVGESRWHLVRGVPQLDEARSAIGWIVSATDIDDRKRAEEVLLETQRELRRLNEAKDAFLALASHELRSPLFAACTQLHLALQQVGGETSGFPGSAFATVRRQVDRMIRLVDDLLDVTRIQAGRLALEPTEFEFSDLAAEVVERIQATTTRHTLFADTPAGTRIVADRLRLDQVLTNLLSNAVRYSPDGGAIEITCAIADDELRIVVRDHGVGIPIDQQSCIFERFGRAHGSRYGGVGLGLAIAAGIVAEHGGRIWVESDGVPGNGSCFHVCIPRRLTAHAAAEVP